MGVIFLECFLDGKIEGSRIFRYGWREMRRQQEDFRQARGVKNMRMRRRFELSMSGGK